MKKFFSAFNFKTRKGWKKSLFFLLALVILVASLFLVTFFNHKKNEDGQLFNYSADYPTSNQVFFMGCQKEAPSSPSDSYDCLDFAKGEAMKKLIQNINQASFYLYTVLGRNVAMNLKLKGHTASGDGLLFESNSDKANHFLSALYYEALTQKGSYAFLDEKGADLLLTNNATLLKYATENNYWWAKLLIKKPERILQTEFLEKVVYSHNFEPIQEGISYSFRIGSFLFHTKPFSHQKTAQKTRERAILTYLYFLFKEKKIFFVLANPANFWMEVKKMFFLRANQMETIYEKGLFKQLKKLNLDKDYLAVNDKQLANQSTLLTELNQFLPLFLFNLKKYQTNSNFSYLTKYFLFSHLKTSLEEKIEQLTDANSKLATKITADQEAIKLKTEKIAASQDQAEKAQLQQEKTELEFQQAEKKAKQVINNQEKTSLITQKRQLVPALGGQLSLQENDPKKISFSITKNDDLQINLLALDEDDDTDTNNVLERYFPLLPALVTTTNLRTQKLFLTKKFYKTDFVQTSQKLSFNDLLAKYQDLWLVLLIFLCLLFFLLLLFYNFFGFLISLITAFFLGFALYLFSFFGVQLTFLTFFTTFFTTLLFILVQIRFFTWLKKFAWRQSTLHANWRSHWKERGQWNYFLLFFLFGILVYLLGNQGSVILTWLKIEIDPHLFYYWGKTLLLLFVAGFVGYYLLFFSTLFLFFLSADRFFKSCLKLFRFSPVSFSFETVKTSVSSQLGPKRNLPLLSFFLLFALVFLFLLLFLPEIAFQQTTMEIWSYNSQHSTLYLSPLEQLQRNQKFATLLREVPGQEAINWNLIQIFDGQKWDYGLEFSTPLSVANKNLLIDLGFHFQAVWTFAPPFLGDEIIFSLKLLGLLATLFALFFLFRFGLAACLHYFGFFILKYFLFAIPLVFFNLGIDNQILTVLILWGVLITFIDFYHYQQFNRLITFHSFKEKELHLFHFLFFLFSFFFFKTEWTALFWNKLLLFLFVFLFPFLLAKLNLVQFYLFTKIEQKWLKIKQSRRMAVATALSDLDQEVVIKNLND